MIRLALLSLAACSLASAAPLATEARSTGDFHAVELAGTLDVDVHVGGARHVEVTGDASALSHVTTEVRDGVLVVSTHGDFHSEHKVKVTISMPALDGVSLTGTGAIDVTDAAGPHLAVALTGTGDIALAGSVGEAAYQLHGTGGVRAKDLAAKSALVALEGTGSIALRASDSVSVAISGVGSVDVFGHPKSVSKTSRGLGRINVHD
ncbi:MAG TPA: DUF2807 domain-containing protein [Kofleriaceae bacterium]|jgi:hypothetical protein